MSRKHCLALTFLTALYALANAYAASSQEDTSTNPIAAVDSIAITVSDADKAVHLGDTALNFQDGLIARDLDGHTTLISGAPTRRDGTALEE